MHESENIRTDLCRKVESISETSKDCYKITLTSESVFFVRQFYLENLKITGLFPGREVTPVELNEIENSTLCTACEFKAMEYLNRSEHSRFLLTQKLRNKGYGGSSIKKSLDYLESEEILSDYRFSICWLRNRMLSNCEGRMKLHGELLKRGVASVTADQALDEFFAEFPESELLRRAYEKLVRINCPKEKIYEKLLRKSFKSSEIKKVLFN